MTPGWTLAWHDNADSSETRLDYLRRVTRLALLNLALLLGQGLTRVLWLHRAQSA